MVKAAPPPSHQQRSSPSAQSSLAMPTPPRSNQRIVSPLSHLVGSNPVHLQASPAPFISRPAILCATVLRSPTVFIIWLGLHLRRTCSSSIHLLRESEAQFSLSMSNADRLLRSGNLLSRSSFYFFLI
ncbi:hypothetical protein HHK36_001230 [Tetracentron sinense]|uniref:Uncharacterized protein n=1 Tax=Tetracentron sinense TaxID=13715 RepID=A0A835DUK8_TETSI|nr:hypothetical protein HHK36_001230 [Tetracentron sinense]